MLKCVFHEKIKNDVTETCIFMNAKTTNIANTEMRC